MSDRVSDVERLVQDVWLHYAALRAAPFVVQPALPILFFGDSARYFASACKIITVGLNPSGREFPAAAPFQRFEGGQALHPDGPAAGQAGLYLAVLGRYFQVEPYRQWFCCFEPILNGLDASYYGTHAYTALNTDLCSPLATAPTWSGLRPAEQALLMQEGVVLWHRLVEYLEPDVIVISVATRLRGLIRFEWVEPWRPIYMIERRKDGTPKRQVYTVEEAVIRLGSGKRTRIVFGRAAHTPFGLISNADKTALGMAIRVASAEAPHEQV